MIEHIRSLSGTHLEPAVVDALLLLLGRREGAPRSRSGDARAEPDRPVAALGLPAPIDPDRLLIESAIKLRRSEAVREEQALRDRPAFAPVAHRRPDRPDEPPPLPEGPGVRRLDRPPRRQAVLDHDARRGPLQILQRRPRPPRRRRRAPDPGGDPPRRDPAGRPRSPATAARSSRSSCPARTPKAGVAAAERLRGRIAGHAWPIRPVTASFGVATMPLGRRRSGRPPRRRRPRALPFQAEGEGSGHAPRRRDDRPVPLRLGQGSGGPLTIRGGLRAACPARPTGGRRRRSGGTSRASPTTRRPCGGDRGRPRPAPG